MNRVSERNSANNTGSGAAGETETSESAVVDIGISVDVSDDRNPAADLSGAEPELEEGELLEAIEGERTTDTAATTGRDTGIGTDERQALEAADIDPDAVAGKEYSYRMLLDAGLDEGIAASLRRRYSLPWSFEGEGDLDRRSSEVRGLGDAEREWIAVSADEEWQAFEYDHSGLVSVGRDRPSERPYPRPTPVTAVTGVGPDDADALAEAGVRSAERLATIDAMTVAAVLDLNVLHVRTWRHNARELLE
ncbi:DUF7409 domain-containing protein [Natrinema ejinorense]|uniref:DUF7409 domain-containing protein n=1 Tax=Natrinema ejinorense TaxID=373386 RepID=A0A2A5QUX9_9EURY|nr:hypothetical protein [Natrinema ejinorense]PCR90668.1 hypothetical protein CP557_09185 [Natrinema ejinorense]